MHDLTFITSEILTTNIFIGDSSRKIYRLAYSYLREMRQQLLNNKPGMDFLITRAADFISQMKVVDSVAVENAVKTMRVQFGYDNA